MSIKEVSNTSIIQQNKYENIPKPYIDVAEGMETQFANHLFTEMEKTVHKETPDSQAESYYKALLNQERAEIMAKSPNGLGVKDLILDEIYPKHMRRPTGQQAINQYSNVQLHKENSSLGEQHE